MARTVPPDSGCRCGTTRSAARRGEAIAGRADHVEAAGSQPPPIARTRALVARVAELLGGVRLATEVLRHLTDAEVARGAPRPGEAHRLAHDLLLELEETGALVARVDRLIQERREG